MSIARRQYDKRTQRRFMDSTLRGSHIPAGADDAELVDDMLLGRATLPDVAELLPEEGPEDVALDVALAEDDIVKLILDVADVRVIVGVVVTIALADEDGTDEETAIDELAELLAEELINEDVRLVAKEDALGLVFAMLDVDRVLALGIALEVLVPDDVVRLVDIVEDNKMLVEDDDPVLSELGELELLVKTIELTEDENVVLEDVPKLVEVDDNALLEDRSGVLEGTSELLAALELGEDVLNTPDEGIDDEVVEELKVVAGPSD